MTQMRLFLATPEQRTIEMCPIGRTVDETGSVSIMDYGHIDFLHTMLDVCFTFVGILECRICMGSRESAETSVVQCEMRYT